jgi:DNA invertase Pin-like site-specific DNA recombinase
MSTVQGEPPMANALIIRRNTQLARAQRALRAAQYVRMSTERQQYSIENQAAVIAAYAQAHNISIVQTYRDDGESGLKLKNRPGLIQLLDDVQSDRAEFDHILVYDVSRWGRFQDTDESAHYEFICKQAGIKVAYCAEQFNNDGTMLSSIVKNIKRVMAAEYSRELSEKVHAGACRFARLGFKTGGRTCYALQRLLVDEKLQPKEILKDGDRKYLTTDHVRLRPGTTDEVAVVKWIFEQFLQRKSETAIACMLNRNSIPNGARKPWDRGHIGRILRNENYIGNIVYNRRSKKLGEQNVYNAPTLWIRGEGCLEPIIDREVFLSAERIIAERRVDLSEPEMLLRLRKTLAKRGKLSPAIIDETVGLPCTATYVHHFGSLREVYRLIGYTSRRNCEYLVSRQRWANVTSQLASQLVARLHRVGIEIAPSNSADCLRLNEREHISFRLARWHPGKRETHAPYWSIKRRSDLPAGWIIVIRLTEQNKDVCDFILLRTTDILFELMRFSETARAHRALRNFGSFEALLRSLIPQLTKGSHATSTKRRKPMRQSERSPKRSSGRARR